MSNPANDNGFAYRTTAFSGDNEWYTPARYVDLARETMGGIDTDPASNDLAQQTVRAGTYYTAVSNGLEHDWHGKVWMNPPYAQPLISQFVAKLVKEYDAGRVSEAIVLTNNAADTKWFTALASRATAFCFTRGRIRFESPTRKTASPAMGQIFSYIGNRPCRFSAVFGDVGHVMTPANDWARSQRAA